MNYNEHKITSIRSIEELVTILSEIDKLKYTDIIRSLSLEIQAFEPYCSWSSHSYTRNCLVENEMFELILICWEKGQITPIHDHGGEECWVKVIQGELKETIYKLDKAGELNQVKSSIAKTGDISYMIDFMGCHRLENSSNDRSMSLHLYARPIRNCQSFDESTGESTSRDLSYDTTSNMVLNLKG